nr:PREDICTED: uncharacterized protein LOC105676678 [Linepithema humile]
MTKNAVVFHGSKSLMAYNRTKNGTLEKKVVENCNSIIADITYCNDVIISSHRDGSLRFWRIQSREKNTNYLTQLKISSIVNNDYIYRLDATSQHIILSCQFFDATEKVSVKIQKNTYKTDGCVERNELFYRNHSLVTSILFDPIGTKFAANIIDRQSRHSSVLIYDIDKSYQIMEKQYDDFFDRLLWEDPQTILTLNEGYIKKIDMRTSKCVHMCDTSSIPEWSDILTCFSSDYLYTIMTGTRNGKIILWDQRKSAPIQMYQMSPKPPDSYLYNIRSDQFPFKEYIHSIQFDSTHLYAVTYDTLIEFDFKRKDYLDYENIKNIFLNYF